MEFQINIYAISENDDLLTIKFICIIKFILVEIVPSVPCMNGVRAWASLLAVSRTRFQSGSDSALCQQFCS